MDPSNQKLMTFGGHLKELRHRVILSLVGLGLAFLICFIFQDQLMQVVVWPHRRVVQWLKATGITAQEQLMSMTYTAPILGYLKLALICAIFLGSPWAGYQMWRFLSAGLYPSEKKFMLTYTPISIALFICGCLLGYFVMIPYGLWFLAIYSDPKIITLTFELTRYLNLVMILTIMMGVLFQLPLVMSFLSRVGFVKPQAFSRGRRLAIVISFLVAAIITPGPDIFTQAMVAIPLCLLYELGILFSRVAAKRAPRH
jgi:Tat protein translocase TatC